MDRGDMANRRIIAHIDMDAFYCQVERGLNPSLVGKPIAVVQYNSAPGLQVKTLHPEDNRINITDNSFSSIIAVSYEARAMGVKRLSGMSCTEMKKNCPELILVQVPTQYHKANTTIYRDAGARVVKALKNEALRCIIERASVDEVYIDLTEECLYRLNGMEEGTTTLQQQSSSSSSSLPSSSSLSQKEQLLRDICRDSSLAGADQKEISLDKNTIRRGHVGTGVAVTGDAAAAACTGTGTGASGHALHTNNEWFSRPIYAWNKSDLLLAIGTSIVSQLRAAVFTHTGYTCSAGIAHNKLLAKMASAMHKPNQQTIVPASCVGPVLKDMPLDRIQGFGGNLGKSLQTEFSLVTLGQLRDMGKDVDGITSTSTNGIGKGNSGSSSSGSNSSRYKLIARYGEKETAEILARAEGIDHDPVQARTAVKSIGSSKAFQGNNAIPLSDVLDTAKYYTTNGSSSSSCSNDSSIMNVNANLNNGKIKIKSKSNRVISWVTALCSDLLERVEADTSLHSRKPKQLIVGLCLRRTSTTTTASTASTTSASANPSERVGASSTVSDPSSSSSSSSSSTQSSPTWELQNVSRACPFPSSSLLAASESAPMLADPATVTATATVTSTSNDDGNDRDTSVASSMSEQERLSSFCLRIFRALVKEIHDKDKDSSSNSNSNNNSDSTASICTSASVWRISTISVSAGKFEDVQAGSAAISSFFSVATGTGTATATGTATVSASTMSDSPSSSHRSISNRITPALQSHTATVASIATTAAVMGISQFFKASSYSNDTPTNPTAISTALSTSVEWQNDNQCDSSMNKEQRSDDNDNYNGYHNDQVNKYYNIEDSIALSTANACATEVEVEGVDMEVFRQLPWELQEEIRREKGRDRDGDRDRDRKIGRERDSWSSSSNNKRKHKSSSSRNDDENDQAQVQRQRQITEDASAITSAFNRAHRVAIRSDTGSGTGSGTGTAQNNITMAHKLTLIQKSRAREEGVLRMYCRK